MKGSTRKYVDRKCNHPIAAMFYLDNYQGLPTARIILAHRLSLRLSLLVNPLDGIKCLYRADEFKLLGLTSLTACLARIVCEIGSKWSYSCGL